MLSHYLPASLYDVLNKSGNTIETAPIIVNGEIGTSVQMNRQEKKHLLCGTCEDLFSKHGEKNVANECYRGPDKFKLLETMLKTTPTKVFDEGKVFFGETLNSKVNVNSYYYFALSVLWRGSSTNWKSSANAFKGLLGNRYEEEFRRYLLNPVMPLENVAVQVFVDCDTEVKSIMQFPTTMGSQEYGASRCKAHSFFIPGIRFLVLVGGELSRKTKHTFDSSNTSFFTWHFSKSQYYREVGKTLKSTEPKGKLAKKWKERYGKSNAQA